MWLAASSGCWAADHSMWLDHAEQCACRSCDLCHSAIAVLSTGYRALGSCPPPQRLERSDFVLWPDSEVAEVVYGFRFSGYSGLVVLTASFRV